MAIPIPSTRPVNPLPSPTKEDASILPVVLISLDIGDPVSPTIKFPLATGRVTIGIPLYCEWGADWSLV